MLLALSTVSDINTPLTLEAELKGLILLSPLWASYPARVFSTFAFFSSPLNGSFKLCRATKQKINRFIHLSFFVLTTLCKPFEMLHKQLKLLKFHIFALEYFLSISNKENVTNEKWSRCLMQMNKWESTAPQKRYFFCCQLVLLMPSKAYATQIYFFVRGDRFNFHSTEFSQKCRFRLLIENLSPRIEFCQTSVQITINTALR